MSTSILRVLTELTALTPNGIVTLKPFRPWFGLPLWRGRNIGFRVLNAQEIQQALEYINDVPAVAQDQALKREIVTRSLWAIDGAYVVPPTDLEEYNKLHSTELSELEYKRVFVAGYEQYFVDYLYTVYTELQKKQIRKVLGLNMCAVCKTQFTKVPADAYSLSFDVAELICNNCFKDVTPDDGFHFTKSVEYAAPSTAGIELDTTEKPVAAPVPEEKPVRKKPTDFATLNEYRDYMIEEAQKDELRATQVQ